MLKYWTPTCFMRAQILKTRPARVFPSWWHWGHIEDGAMLSKASFEVGRPERVFNFSAIDEARHGRPGEMNHSQDKEENENNATINPVKENDNGNAVAIMEQLKEEKKEDEKSQEASGIAVFSVAGCAYEGVQR